MHRLADVLELIHSSPKRFRTARAAGRTGDEPWRLWWAGDAHFRFERDGVAVRNGPVWWMLTADGEAHTNDGNPESGLGMDPAFGLLHTRSLLASAILEVVREAALAGRPAVILRAAPRPGGGFWRWWGFHGRSDAIEVPIDLERGVALGGFGARVDEIAFDEEFPADVIARPYPDDTRTIRHTLVPPRRMSLEEAQAAAGFPVPLPGWLPAGARLVHSLVDPADPPGWVGLVWAIDPGHQFVLRLFQGPGIQQDAGSARLREIVRAGVRVRVTEIGERLTQAFVERGATWVEISSDLPLDTVLAVGLSVPEAR